jgi:fructosamine-3-kinase
MPETFVKHALPGRDGALAHEAASLRWLAEAGGAAIVGVRDEAPDRLELEHVASARPTAQAARAFGAALARTHAAGAAAFGASPDGFAGGQWIGRWPMPTAHESTWGAFYARDRVLPFVATAERVGGVDAAGARLVREACTRIASGAFDDGEAPARLHGDLWSGNVLFSPDGVVLIDPAAHDGHRETDLAMLALFGCPYLDDVLAAYDEAAPLRACWRDRIPLHQLHPLAVHAAGHGPSYGPPLADAARAVLDL